MQNLLKKFSFKKSTTYLCGFLLATSLTGCFKNDDPAPQEQIPVGIVSVYHGIATNQEFDLLADNQAVFNRAIKYSEYTGYQQFRTGNRNFKFTPANAINAVIDTTFNIQDGKYYSLFVAGTEQQARLVAVRDSIFTPVAGKAFLRVINLSPDVASTDIRTTDNVTLADNLPYKSITQFMVVDATTHTLQITGADSEAVLLPNSNVSLAAGNYYTIILRGRAAQPAGSTYGLNAQVVRSF
ncbi:DUF4397 domain-containing protein [Pontibacter qinzhouensis]|uniref:DUF4397 domain-containing protein n=1 Tax=Pontibacter qinzhouensis TaxID=2603253 RepID=A0A5C8K656_9BACT|nr:DUF4397 domain-containing protein [Pontibacter qinzhouensis]TXK44284.1 DUF4397 domain-containing protein [Pontibacter qinzhouensis]